MRHQLFKYKYYVSLKITQNYIDKSKDVNITYLKLLLLKNWLVYDKEIELFLKHKKMGPKEVPMLCIRVCAWACAHTHQERFPYQYSAVTKHTLSNFYFLSPSPKHAEKIVYSNGLGVRDLNPSLSSLFSCMVKNFIWNSPATFALIFCLISHVRKSSQTLSVFSDTYLYFPLTFVHSI